jgi:transcriptional regulator with XRE-family HTH domain
MIKKNHSTVSISFELVGLRIRRSRERLGWSQEELGLRAGISQVSISNMELAKHAPYFARFVAVIGALDLPAKDILVGLSPIQQHIPDSSASYVNDPW